MEGHPNLRRQEILETSDEDIPAAVRVEIARTCSAVSEVRAAYAARVRQTFGDDDGALREGIHVAYELRVPPTSAKEVRNTSIALIRATPRELITMGFTVLSEAALPAWRRRGVRVFERSRA